jgi:hypothetical protein
MSIPIFNVNEMLKYDLDSDEYKKYLEYLNIFNKQDDGKIDQYKKEITDDSYILIDKKDPNKKIIINKSKFIDLNNYYQLIKDEISNILYEIAYLLDNNNIINEDKREKFDILKKKYIEYNTSVKNIDKIFEDDKKIIDDILIEIKDKYTEIINYYNFRKTFYSNIENKITNEKRVYIINIFKEKGNKIPDDTTIVGISKKYDINVGDLDNWFKWIEATYTYIKLQKELFELNDKMNLEIKNRDLQKRYFIYQKPAIEIKTSYEKKIIKKTSKLKKSIIQ